MIRKGVKRKEERQHQAGPSFLTWEPETIQLVLADRYRIHALWDGRVESQKGMSMKVLGNRFVDIISSLGAGRSLAFSVTHSNSLSLSLTFSPSLLFFFINNHPIFLRLKINHACLSTPLSCDRLWRGIHHVSFLLPLVSFCNILYPVYFHSSKS